MDNIKDDTYYVKRILKSIEVTNRYLKDKNLDDLLNDGFLCDALENRFTKIAEDSSKLTKNFKERFNSVPWEAISSIRNRVCHNYDVVDASILYQTVLIDFVSFKVILLKAIEPFYKTIDEKLFDDISNKSKKTLVMLNSQNNSALNVGGVIVYKRENGNEQLITEIDDLETIKSMEDLRFKYKISDLTYVPDKASHQNNLCDLPIEDINKIGLLVVKIKMY